jgi:putative hydrolase of the HAD superfamily
MVIEMDHGSIRLVCFDLGGVLVRICRSWAEGCAAAGLDVRDGNPQSESHDQEVRQLANQLDSGRIDFATWTQQLSAAMRGRYSPQEIAAVHHAWLLDEYRGVGTIIDRLHEAGLRTAALSNTDARHWARMDQFPAVVKLGHRLASFQLKLHKPDPSIYRAAEARLGHSGTAILFFDDRPENVEAARQVGWLAELIDPLVPTDRQIERALVDRGLLSG